MSAFRYTFSSSRYCVGVVGGFFAVLLALGFWLHRDYGVSWDEPNNHLNGLVSVKYLAQLVKPEIARQYPLIPDLRVFRDADHGVAFELPLAVLGYLVTPHDSQAFYYLRHLLIFLVFVLGVWALYKLGSIRYQDWRLGLLAAGLLVLSPRFFAEAFYNGKDIVYMALFTLAMYRLVRLLERPTLGRALVHALVTALAVDVRVQGLLLVPVTLIMLGLEAAKRPNAEMPRVEWAAVGSLYVGAALIFTVLGWPYLWAMSFTELLAATQRISQYPWAGYVVYFGQLLSPPPPWHYLPVWIGITTPLPYTAAAAIGGAAWGISLFRRGQNSLRTFAGRLDWLFIVWLLVPLLLVIGLRAVVYDGWRHLYFIYPAFLLLAVRGAQVVYLIAQRGYWWRRAALAGGFLGVLGTAHAGWRIIRDHPHQQVYFSFLPASYAQTHFDLDYWGLSYRQGLAWVLAHDAAPTITVYSPWPSGHLVYVNSLILPPAERARLRFAAAPNADYILTNYRYRTQSLPDNMGREVHTIRVNGLRILSVFRRGAK
jgi:hypothetical protein